MTINTPSSEWRLTTPSGIPVRVVSRSGSFSEEGGSVQEVYVIKADQLVAFVLESFPLPVELFGMILYPSPRRIPGLSEFTTTTIAFKAHVDGLPIDPFNTDPGAPNNTYQEDVELTITYGNKPGGSGTNSDSDPNDPFTFLEVSAVAGGEFFTFPSRGSLSWEGVTLASHTEPIIGVKDRDVPMSITQPEVEWSLKWSQIPFTFFNGTLMARLRSKLGKVNEATMPVFFNAPPETIMFLGWTVQEQFTWRTGTVGKPPIQIEMKFLEKNFISDEGSASVQVTHNHFYRTSGTDFVPGIPATFPGWRRILVETDTGKESMFKKTDLNEIFTPSS